jgi:hypothetical protein
LEETIKVNTKQWWLTRAPFKVFSATGIRGVIPGKKYNGWIIVMRAHPMDVMGDGKKYKGFPFKAILYTTKSILVDAPAVDWSDAGNNDNILRELLPKLAIEALAELKKTRPQKAEEMELDAADNAVLLEAFENGTAIHRNCIFVTEPKTGFSRPYAAFTKFTHQFVVTD